METKEIVQLKKQVGPVIAKAEAYTITTKEDMQDATVLLSELGRYYDQVVEARERMTTPLNAALKAARDLFNPVEKPAKAAYDALRGRIAAYQTEAVKAAKEEEARIASRVAPGKGNLSFETAIKKMDAIERPNMAISTEAGSLKFRTMQKLVITDPTLIPREYLSVNEYAVTTALKAGTVVPGAVLESVQVPVNFRS